MIQAPLGSGPCARIALLDGAARPTVRGSPFLAAGEVLYLLSVEVMDIAIACHSLQNIM